MRVVDESKPENCATAWFAVMERALMDGDLQRAAHAQRELDRLGVNVRIGNHRRWGDRRDNTGGGQ